MRSTRSIAARSVSVDRVQRQFERWRRQRRPGVRIPDALWRAAVNLALDVGISRTAQHLRLDYYALKDRVEAAPRQASGEGDAGRFVEIPAAAARSNAGCVLEIQGGSAVRLRMELQGMDVAELGSLVRSVLGAAG